MARIYKNPGPLAFTAIIQRNGDVDTSSVFIAFPYDLKETFGVGNLVPFKATFDDRVHYRGSLAKMSGPDAMLLLRKDVRAELGKLPGDSVAVVVKLDDTPREVILAADIKAALTLAKQLGKFSELAYTHRKEYVQWIEGAKRLETRVARIQKMCEMLTQGKKTVR